MCINKREGEFVRRLLASLMVFSWLAGAAMAAEPRTYQVTGPVLDVKEDTFVVQKGDEKWEIGRDKNTRIKGELKKGSRVTVQYRMHASSIDVRDDDKTKAKTEEKKAGSKAK